MFQDCVRSAVALLALALAGTPSFAATATSVVLRTATKGGGFEVYGAALAEVINEADATLRVETRATKGSAENLALLEASQLDIGLVEGNAARASSFRTPGKSAASGLGIRSSRP